MKYEILSESDTLAACNFSGIARFGDGELRLAIGKGCSSQHADEKLALELRDILRRARRGYGVAIPNFPKTPNRETWDRYAAAPFAELYQQGTYGSAFISRPDNAPWIDTPDYWLRVRDLWSAEDVVLVRGDEKSLTPAMLSEAKSVREVIGPRQHAYAEIDRIEEEIGKPAGVVLLSLGATATVLAARLGAKGVRALDLGHIGMFMRHAGAYRFNVGHLRSPDYARLLQQKHASKKWGADGHSHADAVREFAARLGATSLLDYGCGRGTLRAALPDLKVMEYDPGIVGKDKMPKPAPLVVCTDVLEHIEPDRLGNVLQHLFLLAGRGAYLVIATRPARELLPDGRNAHLIVQEPAWWLAELQKQPWREVRHEIRKGLCVWLEK
jgi:hypothetical protein